MQEVRLAIPPMQKRIGAFVLTIEVRGKEILVFGNVAKMSLALERISSKTLSGSSTH